MRPTLRIPAIRVPFIKKPPTSSRRFWRENADDLLSVSQRPSASDAGDRDHLTLNERRRVGFVGHSVQRFHISRRTDQIGDVGRRGTVFKEVLIGSRTELAQIVQHGLVLGTGANLLERGNRHRGQKADDDDDDHDFNKGETFGGLVQGASQILAGGDSMGG